MCINAIDDDDIERMDRSAACVNFDLRMLMRDQPKMAKCPVCGGRGFVYVSDQPLHYWEEAGEEPPQESCPRCHGTGEVPDGLSPCCGAAIERVYYKFGGLRPCAPDDSDYSELACRECGEPCDPEGDGK